MRPLSVSPDGSSSAQDDRHPNNHRHQNFDPHWLRMRRETAYPQPMSKMAFLSGFANLLIAMKYASFDSYIQNQYHELCQKSIRSTYTPRALRLLPMDLMKHCFEGLLQQLILCTLVELADEVSTGLQRLEAELERCSAKILRRLCQPLSHPMRSVAATHHASSVVAEVIATGVHHPKVRHTQTLDPLARGLFPGFAHITQDHIHHSLRSYDILRVFFSMRGFLLFEIDVTPVHFVKRTGRYRSSSLLLGRSEQRFPSEATSVRITKEGLEVGLHFWREKVALYC